MKRHAIYGRFGSEDSVHITAGQNETLTQLELFTSEKKLNYGMASLLDDLAGKGIYPSETGVDLLIVAAHVQAADILISRDENSQDSWTREIRIIVPVLDVDKWNQVSPVLVKMLNFLTGDLWSVSFRPRPHELTNIVPQGTPPLTGVPFDYISLFSGGLDSLIGAIDLLQENHVPLLVSHTSEGAVSEAQRICYEALKKFYPSNNFERLRIWMSFPGLKIEGKEHEKTTRGRSFLFFSLGVFAGTGFNKKFYLRIPENGLIALNVPLDQLRLGSHSTKTTHPFYIAQWNELIKKLQIDGSIGNPYWDKTKGEMVASCANLELLKQLTPNSLSCSSPSKGRYKGHSVQHCGYCLPCLIRRAAINKGLGAGHDNTTYTISDLKAQPLSTLRAEGQQIRSFQFAIKQLKERQSLAKIRIHSSGPLSHMSIADQEALASVYYRGLMEVDRIIDGVQTKPEL
jgi:hypothetical protein